MKHKQWLLFGLLVCTFLAIGAIEPFSPKRPIDMGGNQINNMAAATSNNDAVRKVDAVNASNLASGTAAVGVGGTGQTTYTNGQLLIGNTTGNTLTKATLTAGTGISITNGTGAITLAAADLSRQSKTGNYTVISSDKSTFIRFSSGSYTASLTSASTLGSGFSVWIGNDSTSNTQTLTIDPAGSETIEGKTTLTLYRGQAIHLMSESTTWSVVGVIGLSRSWAENAASNSAQPTATGDSSVAIAPASSASGTSSVAIGASTTASGDYSTAIGADAAGVGSVASGLGAVAFGGGEAASVGAFAFGQDVTSRSTRGGKAWGGGKITTDGDAQYRMQQVRGQTTNATPLVLTADAAAASATNIFRLPNNSTYTYRVMVTGNRTDAAGRASYEFRGCIIRDANAASTALAGAQIKTEFYESTAGYDATVTADTTNGGLIVTVTGAASHTMTWVAHIEAAEATN